MGPGGTMRTKDPPEVLPTIPLTGAAWYCSKLLQNDNAARAPRLVQASKRYRSIGLLVIMVRTLILRAHSPRVLIPHVGIESSASDMPLDLTN